MAGSMPKRTSRSSALTRAGHPMSTSAAPCPECGGSQEYGNCHDLFLSLISLDYEQTQPYAEFHTLNVAGYYLQHPSRASADLLGGQLHMAIAFTNGGLDRVHALANRAVRRNSHRAQQRPTERGAVAPRMTRMPEVTIAAVSVDGTFPAEGYPERIAAWMRDIVSCYDTSTG